MLKSVQRGDVIERLRRRRERACQVAALDFYAIQPEQFRIQVAAAHIKALSHQIFRERALPGGTIQNLSAWQRFQYLENRFVKPRPRDRFRPALSRKHGRMIRRLNFSRRRCRCLRCGQSPLLKSCPHAKSKGHAVFNSTTCPPYFLTFSLRHRRNAHSANYATWRSNALVI